MSHRCGTSHRGKEAGDWEQQTQRINGTLVRQKSATPYREKKSQDLERVSAWVLLGGGMKVF